MSPASESSDDAALQPITCPLLFLAAALALGIGLSAWRVPDAGSSLAPSIPLLIAGVTVCLIAALLLVRAGRIGASAAIVLAGFTLAGVALPILFAHRFPPNHVSHLEDWGSDPDQPLQVEGTVLTEPISTPSGLQFDLAAARLSQPESSRAANPERSSRHVSGKIRVRLESPAAGGLAARGESGAENLFDLRPGDLIDASMLLRRPHVYQNPGSFDFRKRAEEIEDLYWEGSVSGAVQIHNPQPASGLHWSQPIWRARERVRNAIDRLYPPWSVEGRDGAVLKAILLGDRSSLDSATIDHFRASGLYHLLVIAGLHVGLIAGLVLGFLRLLGLNQTWRNVLLLAVLLGYALLVEQRAPTLRATLMIVAFVVANLLGRGHAALNSVGLAAMVLLLVRPAWLFDSGFQLSFAAALLIVGLAGPLLRRSIEPYHWALAQLDNADLDAALAPRHAQFRLDLRSLVSLLRGRSAYLDRHPVVALRLIVWPVGGALRLVEIAALSGVLQIGLLLPMVETFHRVTFAGIGLNALALPLMAVLLAIAIPTVALAVFAPTWAVVPGRILALVFAALFRIAGARLPDWLSYRVPSPPLVVALGFTAALIALAVSIGRWRVGAMVSIAAFAVFAYLLAMAPFAADLPASGFELTALDCGRGRAEFAVLPGGSTMLIDAGGIPAETTSALTERWDPGENIVAPYLWWRRVKNLDVLVATGPNLDGVAAIAGDFQMRELWLAPQRGGWSTAAMAAVALAARRGTIIRPIAPGDVLRLGGTIIQVAGSSAGGSDSDSGESLTLRLADSNGSVLLAGEQANEIRFSLSRPSVIVSRNDRLSPTLTHRCAVLPLPTGEGWSPLVLFPLPAGEGGPLAALSSAAAGRVRVDVSALSVRSAQYSAKFKDENVPASGGPGSDPHDSVLVIDRRELLSVARANLLAGIGAEAVVVSPGPTAREDSAARRALPGLDLKMRVFETDMDGAVTALMKSGSVEIRTFRSGRIGGIQGR
jgi:ComEC/Rec2-related protein